MILRCAQSLWIYSNYDESKPDDLFAPKFSLPLLAINQKREDIQNEERATNGALPWFERKKGHRL
jgi:hypothetical protein